MTATIEISTLITKTDDICGNRPRIAGTRLSVQQIVVLTKQGLTPLDIVKEYKNLSLAKVHAALAYYYANQKEIEGYLAEEKLEYEQLLAESKASQSS